MELMPTVATRDAARPLQVYLDSSDYSNLAEASNGSREFDQLREMIELVAGRQIEIRFSAIHIVEMTHLERHHLAYAERRARVLERLSEGRCFALASRVAQIELQSWIDEIPPYQAVLQDNDAWMPDLRPYASGLKDQLCEAIRSAIVKGSENRTERRRKLSQAFRGQCLRRDGLIRMGIDPRQMSSELIVGTPLEGHVEPQDLVRCAVGDLDEGVLLSNWGRAARKPEAFVSWAYEQADEEAKHGLIGWLRDAGAVGLSKLNDLRQQVETLREKDESRTTAAVREAALDGLERGRAQEIDEVSAALSEGARRALQVRGAPQFGDLPHLDSSLTALKYHLEFGSRSNRVPQVSDAGDLLHMAYIPYCHIFRCDKAMKGTAERIASAYGTRVVPRLGNLLSAIHEELGTRS